MTWYSKVRQNIANIVPAIEYFEKQLDEARLDCGLKGNVEKHSRDMPGIVEYRFNQLQELEAILEYLNIEMRKIRNKHYRIYLEGYNLSLIHISEPTRPY